MVVSAIRQPQKIHAFARLAPLASQHARSLRSLAGLVFARVFALVFALVFARVTSRRLRLALSAARTASAGGSAARLGSGGAGCALRPPPLLPCSGARLPAPPRAGRVLAPPPVACARGAPPPRARVPRAPPPRAGVLGVRGVPFAALWGSPPWSLCARFARVAPAGAPVLACAVGGRSVGGAFRAPSGVFAARPPLRPRGSGLRSGLRSGLYSAEL